MRNILSVATLLTLLSALPSDAAGQILSFEIRDGLVTLDARNVSVWEILQRWATVGDVTFVDGERIPPTPVTLVLTKVSETEALKTLLRDVSGYIVGKRDTPNAASSSIDRVLIVAASTAPRPAAVATPPRGDRVIPSILEPQGQPDEGFAEPVAPIQLPPYPGAGAVAPARNPATGAVGFTTIATGSAGRATAQTRPGTVSTPPAPAPQPSTPIVAGAPTGMIDSEGNPVIGPTPIPDQETAPTSPSTAPTPPVTRPGTISPTPRTQP